jgi:hypothetical protein
MTANKTGKYLKYAIGEIILVVFGILIALQINTWNEERKAKAQERDILLEIKDNLNTDIVNMKDRILSANQRVNYIDFLIEHIEEKKEYNDSLARYFFVPDLMEEFNNSTSGYETLKSMGIEKIHSTSIKRSLSNYYDIRCAGFIDGVALKNLDNTRSMSHYKKEHFKRITFSDNNTGFIPTNYDDLINDKFYLNYLYERKGYMKRTYIGFQEQIILICNALIVSIEDEINKK